MKIRNHIKSFALVALFMLSFSAYCFLNVESQKQDTNQTNLISVPVQETDAPSLPDVKILYYILEHVKGGIIPGS